jgi:hypothetical protein
MVTVPEIAWKDKGCQGERVVEGWGNGRMRCREQQWKQTTFEPLPEHPHRLGRVGARKENIETPTPLLHSLHQDLLIPYYF